MKKKGNEVVEEKTDKANIVVKHNDLIQSRYDLTLNEQKIILYAISKIDRRKEDFSIIKIKLREFARLIGSTEKRYTEIREIVRRLRSKEIIIRDGKNEIITGWLSSIEYIDNEGVIEIEFSDKLVPYLLQLRKQFTSYELKNVLFLNNKHSIRLYELFKQYEVIGKRKLSIVEIREFLMLGDKYPDNKNFVHIFLKRSIKEINEKTDINVEYDLIKENNKITKIMFNISPKNIDEYTLYLNDFYDIKEMQKQMGLMDENFSPRQIMEIYSAAVDVVKDYEDVSDIYAYVNWSYFYVKLREKESEIKNFYGYLLTAVQENYIKYKTPKNKNKQNN